MNRNEDNARLLGLDIGGTKCAALLGTPEGRIIDRMEWPSEAGRGPEAMIADLLARSWTLLERHGRADAVGVSIGGPLDARRGVILGPPNLPGWDDVPLAARLGEALSLPVRIMHDAAACALAEWRLGSGRELPEDATLVYLTCGTGFGAGLIVGGRLVEGADGQPPEFGHVRLAEVGEEGPMAFGRRGTAEALCSGPGLSRIAAWRFPDRWREDRPAPKELVDLAIAADADARAVLAAHAEYTGRACAILIDTLRPSRVVLGSLARRLPEAWFAGVRAAIAAEALPAAVAACEVAPAVLGERLQDLSALMAATRAVVR
jgi:glucokinase